MKWALYCCNTTINQNNHTISLSIRFHKDHHIATDTMAPCGMNHPLNHKEYDAMYDVASAKETLT
jgi:hypothetical protein